MKKLVLIKVFLSVLVFSLCLSSAKAEDKSKITGEEKDLPPPAYLDAQITAGSGGECIIGQGCKHDSKTLQEEKGAGGVQGDGLPLVSAEEIFKAAESMTVLPRWVLSFVSGNFGSGAWFFHKKINRNKIVIAQFHFITDEKHRLWLCELRLVYSEINHNADRKALERWDSARKRSEKPTGAVLNTKGCTANIWSR
jgi:hypothetical protein